MAEISYCSAQAAKTSVSCAFAVSKCGCSPQQSERTQLCAEQQRNPGIIYSLVLAMQSDGCC